jgi:hypothetical protein
MSNSCEPAPSDTQPGFSRKELDALAVLVTEHPAAANSCAHLQVLGVTLLHKLIDDLTRKLAEQETGQPPAGQGGTDFRQLAAAARNRESDARERRALAQDLVLGAIINLDNPDWNPLDPATSRRAEDSALLAFLGMTGGFP